MENIADRRVYEILAQKFELFEGVFGASDKAIGLLESVPVKKSLIVSLPDWKKNWNGKGVSEGYNSDPCF